MIRVHTIDIEFSHYSNTLPSSLGEPGIGHPTPVMLMQCRQRWGGHTRPTRNLSNSSEQKRNQDERPLVNYVTLNSRANLIDFYTNGGRDQVLSAGDMSRDVIFPLVIIKWISVAFSKINHHMTNSRSFVTRSCVSRWRRGITRVQPDELYTLYQEF